MHMVALAACGHMHQAARLRQNRLQPRAPDSSQPDLGAVVALRADALAAHRDGRAGPLCARGLKGCRVPPRLACSGALRPAPHGMVRPGGPQATLGLARQTLACWEPVCPAAPRAPWGPATQQRAPARTGYVLVLVDVCSRALYAKTRRGLGNMRNDSVRRLCLAQEKRAGYLSAGADIRSVGRH